MKNKVDDGLLLLSVAMQPQIVYHLLHESIGDKNKVAMSVLFEVLYILSNYKHLTLREFNHIDFVDVYTEDSIKYILDLCFNYSIDIPKNCDLKS